VILCSDLNGYKLVARHTWTRNS